MVYVKAVMLHIYYIRSKAITTQCSPKSVAQRRGGDRRARAPTLAPPLTSMATALCSHSIMAKLLPNSLILMLYISILLLKFMFSKKATKFEEIFTVDLTLFSKCQINGEDFVNFCGLLRKDKLCNLENHSYTRSFDWI